MAELAVQRAAAERRVELVERLGKRAGLRIEDDDADQLRTVDSATAFLARGASRKA